MVSTNKSFKRVFVFCLFPDFGNHNSGSYNVIIKTPGELQSYKVLSNEVEVKCSVTVFIAIDP